MKKLIVYILSLVILLTGCGTPTQAPTLPPPPTSTIVIPTDTQVIEPTPEAVILTGCVNIGSLRVRSSPGTQSDILGGLIDGTCVAIVGRDEGAGWVLVSSDELSGWVSSEYMNIDGDVTALTIITDSTAVADIPIAKPKPTTAVRKTNTPRPPTPIAKKTSTPRPEYILCKDTRNSIGSYITCKIPRAYCSICPL